MAETTETEPKSFQEELALFWRELPFKGMFFGLLGAWVLLFQFLGNSTLGYIDTSSLFGWLLYAYENSVDNQHGYFIPLVVLALYWWKRDELAALPKRHWWPALILLVVALLLHIVGFMVQQTRLSVVGFFGGIYALSGLVWGPRWLLSTFFPFFLFAFCVPIATLTDTLTFPLRLIATEITGWVCGGILGINVVCTGTQIYEPNGAFKYEVAAACSGIRSLTAILAISVIYGFTAFKGGWKRWVMVASAIPVAVAANVFRLTMIIIASEIYGQSAGEFVHEDSIMSLLPYIPAVFGVFLLGWFLSRENNRNRPSADPDGTSQSPQPAS